MAQNQNTEKDFLEKINKTLPEDGILTFPESANEGLMEILQAGRVFILAVRKYLPHSRERSLALTKLEECLAWVFLGMMRR